MAKIKIGKQSPDELHVRSETLGMVSLHDEHVTAIKEAMTDAPRGSSRRSEFAKQLNAHLTAGGAHFREANKMGPKKASAIFEAKDHGITPQSKRRYN